MGTVIGYSYSVTNSGNTTLSGAFTVSDDKTTDESCPVTASLAPGAFITCTSSYTITQADLDSAGVTLTANMKLRFNTNDAGAQSINESGLDAFHMTSFTCTEEPCSGADGDLNLDGFTNGVDIQFFVNGVINGATPDEECHGDFDGMNGLDGGDIVAMVDALLTAP